MKRIHRPAHLAVMAVLLLAAACSRKESASGASEAGPARATNVPYLTRVEEIRVEYRPLDIPATMAAGSEVTVRFEAKNTGNTTWPAHGTPPFRFGYHWADPEGTGSWDSVVWDDGNRGDLTVDVPPGGVATITLPVRALPKRAKGSKLIIAPLFERSGGWSVDVPYVATVDIS